MLEPTEMEDFKTNWAGCNEIITATLYEMPAMLGLQ